MLLNTIFLSSCTNGFSENTKFVCVIELNHHAFNCSRECPLDLKEAISSICFAAPRCADLPELLQVQLLFAGKYGKEFVAAATELMPECGVNRQVIKLKKQLNFVYLLSCFLKCFYYCMFAVNRAIICTSP